VRENTIISRKINNAALILLIASFVSSVILVSECFSPSVVGDEIFSLRLISSSFREIISLTARDVHPPLYYLILKSFVDGGALLGIPAVSMAKLCSATPIILLQIFSIVQVTKKRHILAYSIFSLLMVVAPRFVTYGSQIRMYSWGMFFLVMAYVWSEKIISWLTIDEPNNNPKLVKIAWIGFVFWALCGAYTQYFALVAVTGIYVFILVETVIQYYKNPNKSRKNTMSIWVVATGISIILYLPWLVIAIKQVMTVNGGYWIPEISVKNFLDYFQFMFNANAYYFHAGTIWGILLVITLILLIIYWNRAIGSRDRYLISGILLPIYVILIGVSISIISQPIFTERYIFLTMGVFWFAVSRIIEEVVYCEFDYNKENVARNSLTLCGNNTRRLLVCTLIVLLGVFSYINLSWFVRTEEEYKEGWSNGIGYLSDHIASNDVILSNDGGIGRALSYLYPDNQVGYYWRKQTDPLFLELHGNFHDLRDVESILEFMNDSSSLWLMDLSTANEFHFVEDLGDNISLLETEKIGTYNIEGSIVSLYNIKKIGQ